MTESAGFAEFGEDLKTVHLRHFNIKKDRIKIALFNLLNRLQSIDSNVNFKSAGCEEAFQYLPVFRIVIGYENHSRRFSGFAGDRRRFRRDFLFFGKGGCSGNQGKAGFEHPDEFPGSIKEFGRAGKHLHQLDRAEQMIELIPGIVPRFSK